MNLMMLLEMAASAYGERVAIQNGTDRLTYAELFSAAGVAAAAFSKSGSERLAILDVNSLAVPVGLFASAWAGAPFVPLSYRLTEAELDGLLDRISPCTLVTDAQRVGPLSARGSARVLERDAFLGGALEGAAPDGGWPMDPEDIAILLFTSGTTGAPKGAVLRHRHLVSYVLGSVEFGSAGEDEATLVSVPPYHVAGMAAIVSSVYAGRRVVQLPSFTAEGWLEVARREGVTNAFVVPTMLARIVDRLEREPGLELPDLRALSYGGGKMPQPVIESAIRRLPAASFTQAYGLTETSSTITLLGPEEHRAAMETSDPAIRRRLVSVGRALPNVEIQIRDEEGRPVGPGERGEVWVRGEQVSGEYLGTGAGLDPEGWFPTRDGGSLDGEGYLFLEGRIDDVIVRGGENMSPGEIEDVLLQHERVADVAVVGIPDEQWGEAVAAVVVPRPGPAPSVPELQAWVRDRLRSSRTPQRIEFRDELPYNETGKLLRRRVRRELVGEES